MTNDLVHGLLEVGDEALWIWSHALIASTLGAQGGSNEDIGVREYELRVRAENGQSLSFKVTAEIRAAGTSVLILPQHPKATIPVSTEPRGWIHIAGSAVESGIQGFDQGRLPLAHRLDDSVAGRFRSRRVRAHRRIGSEAESLTRFAHHSGWPWRAIQPHTH